MGVVPAIVPLFKPRMTGMRYVRRDGDRLIFTWDLREPDGGIFDFTAQAAPNTFQAVLHLDGTIEMSYAALAVSDGITGVLPTYPEAVVGDVLVSIDDPMDTGVVGYLDVLNVTVREIPDAGVEVAITLVDDVPASGDSRINQVYYRLHVDSDSPLMTVVDFDDPDFVWSVYGTADNQWATTGDGITGDFSIDGNVVRMRAAVPDFSAGGEVAVFADSVNFSDFDLGFDQTSVSTINLPAVNTHALDLSQGGESAYPHEIFHHHGLPDEPMVACDVLTSVGDAFDFMVFYSAFRTDQQESGSPVQLVSNDISGTGQGVFDVSSAYCTDGKLQSALIQPLFIDSLQGTDDGPAGFEGDYNFAMSQVGHELVHRWTANVRAEIDGVVETLNDGNHWLQGVHAPAAYPWQQTEQASAMGGGFWRDNGNGTYTQVADNFFVPASGFSYLDLYLMGLMAPAEVPDFFILDQLVIAGNDNDGPVYAARHRNVTIEDVIAAEGERLPTSGTSQKDFNVAFVFLTADGLAARADHLARVGAIRDRFLEYWGHVTGGRSTMTSIVPGAPAGDFDGDGIADDEDVDDDNDGVADEADAFPLDAAEQTDTDGDGTGNNADNDDDGDGVADEADAFPLDPTRSDAGNTSRLQNISTRGRVLTADEVMIGGLIISGTEDKTVLIRARGPSLADAGVPGVLPDPTLELFSGANLLETNNNWADHLRAGEIPVALQPTRVAEAVIVRTLGPGGYTAIVRGVSGTGVGIVEIFELTDTGATRLTNISTRGSVGTDDDVMIGGVIVAGSADATLLLRARGPSLADAGVAGALADPSVELFDAAGSLLESNDNWQSHPRAGEVPTALQPTNANESAIVRTVSPGAYTAVVRGVGDTTGVGIVEVFELDN